MLIPDGETHVQVTYPTYEEIRRAVLSHREAEQRRKQALDDLARLGVTF